MSDTASATAPGKIMLAGEYAVLDGHVAVLMAVDRRVRARFGETESDSPLIRHLAEVVGARDPERGRAALRIEVDSRSLFDGDDKIGLGSSAAVAVAAAALALGSERSELVMRIAFEAHGRAQAERGSRGSGADIAAAAYGGVVAVRSGGVAPLDVKALSLPAGVVLVPVWTGTSADTAPLVARVQAAWRQHRSRVEPAIAEIAAASRRVIDACGRRDARELVGALHAGAEAHDALARATGVELVTASHRRIRAIAASRGGAAKPTGAGGGDVALAAFTDPDAAQRFQADLALAGMRALALSVDPRGAALEDLGAS